MEQLRKVLTQLLELSMSDSAYLFGQQYWETYVTELTVETSSVLFVYPQSDNFMLYFREFDVWAARSYILYEEERYNQTMPFLVSVILLKMENWAQLIIYDEEGQIWLDCKSTTPVDAFHIGIVGYGLLMDKHNHEEFSRSSLSMIVPGLPAEVCILLLNICFAGYMFERAILMLRLMDTDCLQYYLYYVDIQLCRNFKMYYLACCICAHVRVLPDYEQLIYSVEHSDEDTICLTRLDDLAGQEVSRLLTFQHTMHFFPKSDTAQRKYIECCRQAMPPNELFTSYYISMIYCIGCQCNDLNEIFDRYRTDYALQYLMGFLILLSVNQCFFDANFYFFVDYMLSSINTMHFEQQIAYLIQTRINQLISAGMEGKVVFYLFKHKDVFVSAEMHRAYPFLKQNDHFLYFEYELFLDSKINTTTEADAAEDDTCPVCLDKMLITAYLACSHKLCAECLQQLDHCPLCRLEIASFQVAGVVYY